MRVLVLVLILVAGCSPAADPDPYRVHVPAGLAGPAPLVVVLHGGGGNGAQVAAQTGFNAVADREGFVVAYPDGSGRTRLLTWNAGACCGYARDLRLDHVGFIRVMLDEMLAKYPIDPARVYVTGFSNGAMMAYRLGCELTDRIAAIAPVAGALNTSPCRPTRPLPVLIMHGTADAAVPIAGGPPLRDIPGTPPWQNASLASAQTFWAEHNGCPRLPVVSHDGAVTTTTWGSCEADTEVVTVLIEGGGHAWPGGTKGRAAADDPPAAPDASTLIWSFVKRHHR